MKNWYLIHLKGQGKPMPKLHRGKSGNKVQNRSCLNSQSIFKMGFSMKEQNAFILFWFSSHPLSVSVVDSMAAASAGLQSYVFSVR